MRSPFQNNIHEEMMSKEGYQECLETLLRFAHESPNVKWALIHERIRLENLIETYPEYLELKAKATPMKPNNYRKYSSDSDAWGKCPNCNKEVCDYAGKYCPNCSQALDWSENDE